MHKAKVTIIEDEFYAALQLSSEIEQMGYEPAGIYHSGEDFLNKTNWDFDLAIVDIFLSKKLTGLDVAEKIKEQKKPFIFLTANQDDRTLENAARLRPSAYITKPFKVNDVKAALQSIVFSMPSTVEIHGHHGKEYIQPSDILFVKSDRVYIEIQHRKGPILQRKLLKEIMEVLPENFVRIHRSYVINTDYLESKTSNSVMVGGHQIPVSRSYKEALDKLEF